MRRVLLALAISLVVTDTAAAQIIRPPARSGQASAWTSLSIGWLQQQGLCDRNSNDCWDFGSGPQWRASLEMPMGFGGTTVGLVGTIAKMPLIYNGSALSTNSCAGCDADATVSQVMANVRMGGGLGFHQVVDLSAGTTMFSNFRASNGGAKLGTGKMTQDFTFAVAYGFGYGMSPRTQFFFTQEFALLFLPRVAGSNSNTAQQATLRLGARYGLGGK
ncbi:MAG TPA: hypothetical protein VFT29_20395 [Gemmatimonadaceae bacterium]|nr:hypothetical protein [Gemmatimonadaceae bacterium]